MRANLYLLGAALFDAPRRENRNALRALMWRVIYRSPLDARWVKPLLEIADAHEREEKLDHEYRRLFLDGVGAQPFGSYWLESEREPMGATTHEVEKLMRRHAFSLDRAGMLPDHLIAEMEFMAALVTREKVEATRAAQEQMLRDHLGVWVPMFIDALRGIEPSRYYRMAALYLNHVIAWESHRLHAAENQPVAA